MRFFIKILSRVAVSPRTSFVPRFLAQCGSLYFFIFIRLWT